MRRSGGSKRFGGSEDKRTEQSLQMKGIHIYGLFDVTHDQFDSEGAMTAALKSRRKELALMYHPDKHKGRAANLAAAKMTEINAAYDLIKTASLRETFNIVHHLIALDSDDEAVTGTPWAEMNSDDEKENLRARSSEGSKRRRGAASFSRRSGGSGAASAGGGRSSGASRGGFGRSPASRPPAATAKPKSRRAPPMRTTFTFNESGEACMHEAGAGPAADGAGAAAEPGALQIVVRAEPVTADGQWGAVTL